MHYDASSSQTALNEAMLGSSTNIGCLVMFETMVAPPVCYWWCLLFVAGCCYGGVWKLLMKRKGCAGDFIWKTFRPFLTDHAPAYFIRSKTIHLRQLDLVEGCVGVASAGYSLLRVTAWHPQITDVPQNMNSWGATRFLIPFANTSFWCTVLQVIWCLVGCFSTSQPESPGSSFAFLWHSLS